jgi:LysM repeat protein
MRKLIFVAILTCFLLGFLAESPSGTQAQAGDAGSLIAEVNALRASYGLPPYQVDHSLMASAQAHSEYQAQIGSATHSGAGGSRPHDRAVAAGYGGGALVYISENVATGTDLSPQQTVYDIWQDAVHLDTMISPNYRDIGAGVAFSGAQVYYTIDVGYIAGSSSGSATENPSSGESPGTATPDEAAMVPVQVATPMPDGSIWHVVQWGQFLENIARAYGVPVQQIMALNGLAENTTIYEGDKLLIRVGTTPVATQSLAGTAPPASGKGPLVTDENAKTPDKSTEPARPPTRTPLPPTVTPVALARVTGASPTAIAAQGMESSISAPGRGPDYLLITIMALGFTGIGLIALGTALKRAV